MPAPEQGEDNSFLLSSHPRCTKFILLPVSVNPVASNPVLETSRNCSYTTGGGSHTGVGARHIIYERLLVLGVRADLASESGPWRRVGDAAHPNPDTARPRRTVCRCACLKKNNGDTTGP